jgi:hypothetical protein
MKTPVLVGAMVAFFCPDLAAQAQYRTAAASVARVVPRRYQ